MASLNKVQIIGNLTRDPELKSTPKGTAVTEVGIATNRKYKAESGEQREEVTFIDVTVWGKTAEVMAQYLRKGSSVYIEGRLQLDSWDDKTTGQKRSKLKVIAQSFEFLDSRQKPDPVNNAPENQYQTPQQLAGQMQSQQTQTRNDVPF
tara:strand:+ start:117 stop:563 length:447 start_codon:yes stop_codon:yes gene_type:complete